METEFTFYDINFGQSHIDLRFDMNLCEEFMEHINYEERPTLMKMHIEALYEPSDRLEPLEKLADEVVSFIREKNQHEGVFESYKVLNSIIMHLSDEQFSKLSEMVKTQMSDVDVATILIREEQKLKYARLPKDFMRFFEPMTEDSRWQTL